MAQFIEVTEAGGAALGSKHDVKISLNSEKILKIEDVHKGVGNSKITMEDNSEIFVTEQRENLSK